MAPCADSGHSLGDGQPSQVDPKLPFAGASTTGGAPTFRGRLPKSYGAKESPVTLTPMPTIGGSMKLSNRFRELLPGPCGTRLGADSSGVTLIFPGCRIRATVPRRDPKTAA